MESEDHEMVPFPYRKKHRTPSPASESKRRKHHHHHHRRHHRHHYLHQSKRDKEKDEKKEENVGDAMACDAIPMVEDGELEEGEIVEVGEIVPDNDELAPCRENQSFLYKEHKALDRDLDSLHVEVKREITDNTMNCESWVKHSESPSRKIEAVPRFGDGESEDSKNGHAERKEAVSMDDDDSINGNFRNRARSISPFSRDRVYEVKYKDWKLNNETVSDHSLGRHRNNEGTIRSPSRRRHYSEACHRDRSRSHDSDYDRTSRDDRRGHHTVRSRQSDVEMDGGHKGRDKSIYHSKHAGPEDSYDNYDKQKESDIGFYKEREMSASYSRHERRESKHSERDRESDVNTEHRRGRDRSSSISSRHDRGRGRTERERGSVKDRDMEKPSDLSKERYNGRGQLRDKNIERERDSYGYDRDRGRIRDQELNVYADRERGRQIERDRVNNRDKCRDSRHSRYDEQDHHRDITRLKECAKESNSAKSDYLDGKVDFVREDDEECYQERIEQQLAKHDEEDLDKIKEESRKRRQAILEKYKQQQLQKHAESPSDDHQEEDEESIQKDKLRKLDYQSLVREAFVGEHDVKLDCSDVSASDPTFTVRKSPKQNGAVLPERNGGAGGLGEGTPKSERSTDMFCDDIFGESPVGFRRMGKGDGLQIERSGLHDNWDDAEGYYSYRFGEVLDGRYEVIAGHGKGVFSTVVRAKDLKAGKGEPAEVAIKIIRSNETMYKAGQEELKILGKLAAADPEDKRHCVRFLSTFKYRNHLCLVFESLHMNLREVLKKFGRNIGLKLTAVRTYAKQLFIALKHLRNCGVLHCDIKPDNMLVNESKNVLKLCDFGNAMSAGKNEPTPYLVSRFYRAPEIILGLDYDHPLDMWSVGCCLYELYAGKVLFPGPSNNDMLRLHTELKGSFPKKMLRKGLFTNQHFDQDLNFLATEEDPVTRKTIKRLLLNIKPKDISALISSSPGEVPKMVAHFKDLLERIFVLDPEKRITVSQALSHPFITDHRPRALGSDYLTWMKHGRDDRFYNLST